MTLSTHESSPNTLSDQCIYNFDSKRTYLIPHTFVHVIAEHSALTQYCTNVQNNFVLLNYVVITLFSLKNVKNPKNKTPYVTFNFDSIVIPQISCNLSEHSTSLQCYSISSDSPISSVQLHTSDINEEMEFQNIHVH